MLRMADSINPADLPPGMDAYAGYDNGNWPDYQAIAAQHGSAHLLDLTVFFANTGQGIDIEPGDAIPANAPGYVAERTAAGVWRPVVYCAQSDLGQVVAALHAFPRSAYRLLSAHYNASLGAHICSPAACGAAVQCDGTQWVDHGPWDESLLADDFFGAPPAPKPPPPPPPPPEFNMIASTPSGNGYWILHPDGSVWAYGDAQYYGGCNVGASAPFPAGETAISIEGHPGGEGYWILSNTHAVYAFGAAGYHGAPPA